MPYKEGHKWRAKVTFKGQRYTALLDTKQNAKLWEHETKRRLRQKDKRERKGMDLMTFCTKYLDYAMRFSAKSYDEKRAVCRRILEAWGADAIVDEITIDDAETFLQLQKDLRTRNAANKDRKNLLAMWNKGVKSYGIEKNPFSRTDKFPHDVKSHYVPSMEDVQKFFDVLSTKDRVFILAFLETGARRSEIFRWKWADDIDFQNMRVRIGTRKTKDRSMRYHYLPMSDVLYNALIWLKGNLLFENQEYVFVNETKGAYYGKPYRYRDKFMKKYCKRAGIKFFGFHGLRGYVASVYAANNVPLKKISFILGHQAISTTEIYIRNIEDGMKDVMNIPKILNEKARMQGTKQEGVSL